jgi:hypothetical protein
MILGYISAGKIYFNKFLDLIERGWLAVLDRVDRAIGGNDGSYSNTRIVNLMWNIGGFCLVCIMVLREIKVPDTILMLLAGAMGITGIQNVVNKGKELAFVAKQMITTDKPVADEVKDDKSN